MKLNRDVKSKVANNKHTVHKTIQLFQQVVSGEKKKY